MKKFVATILILTFIIPFGFAESEYSTFTDDELLGLRNVIDQEIVARGIEFETNFYSGVYVVGKDIIEGDFDILFDDIDEWGGVEVNVFSSKEGMENGDRIFHELVEQPSNGVHIQLKNGMVLEIDPIGGGQMRIKKSKPIWKP